METIPPFELDRNQIEQVVVNVLKNAMESIGEDGRITLRLDRVAGGPRLRLGIPEEVRALSSPPSSSQPSGTVAAWLTLVQEILCPRLQVQPGTGEGGGGGVLGGILSKAAYDSVTDRLN